MILRNICTLILLLLCANSQCHDSTPFVIVTASYNNQAWCMRNLESIFTQDYDNWRLVYINDCSTDATQTLVEELITRYNVWHKVTLIHNTQRKGHLHNHYYAIHACANHEVVVMVDGDDWLVDSTVLRYLDTLYSQGDIWLTYGQFWYWKRNRSGYCRPLPCVVLQNSTIRDYPYWVVSHLRTFYAGLYKLINIDSLLYEEAFFPMCADVCTMIPMIEMAGERVCFISKILYVYNDANALSFFHTQEDQQNKFHKNILARPKYQRLEKASFLVEG